MSPQVEELKVYEMAVVAADGIFDLTARQCFDEDPELRAQLRRSSGRIQANLQEGSGQGTDRHYAQYVITARGSSKEVKAHLRRALGYRYITEVEYKRYWNLYDEIARMLTGLKKHLERSNWKSRA
jgi:four helix bundle protein